MSDINLNATTWTALKPVYKEMLAIYKQCHVWKARIIKEAAELVKGKDRYKAVEARTGVDWKWLAAVHNLEGSGNFKKGITEGETIKSGTWEDDAVKTLDKQGVLKLVKDNPVDSKTDEFWLWLAERWNGFGYRKNAYGPTPYLWSGTDLYKQGKYAVDGKYDPDLTSDQVGFVPMWVELKAGEPAVVVPPVGPVDPVPAPTKWSFWAWLWSLVLWLFGKR